VVKKLSLNYIAPINTLGYGVAGANLFSAFINLGVDVKLWPIGQIENSIVNISNSLNNSVLNRHKYDVNAPSLRIWHQKDLSLHVGHGIHSAMPIFELNKFTQVEKDEISRQDIIFVCSEWAKSIVCEECDIDNVYVVPLGVDTSIFSQYNTGVERSCPDCNWTTFLNIGKWEYRKGHDIIWKAFEKAFTPTDRVRLWMMNDNPFISKGQTTFWESLYKKSRMSHRISFLPRVKTHEEVCSIMKEADCGVFPSRAEGWNLELLEMMALGKPVITTNYSAHTEFCNDKNSYLIPILSLELAKDDVFFDGKCGGQWANLGEEQIDYLVEYMREIHREKPKNKEGIKTGCEFTWKKSAEIILNTLKE
jgi:hypothetical protein